MESGAVGIIEPVARVKRQQLDLGAIRQIGGLVYDESAAANVGFDRHTDSVASGEPPNKPLQPASGAGATFHKLESLLWAKRHRGGWPVLVYGSSLRGRLLRPAATVLRLVSPGSRRLRIWNRLANQALHPTATSNVSGRG